VLGGDAAAKEILRLFGTFGPRGQQERPDRFGGLPVLPGTDGLAPAAFAVASAAGAAPSAGLPVAGFAGAGFAGAGCFDSTVTDFLAGIGTVFVGALALTLALAGAFFFPWVLLLMADIRGLLEERDFGVGGRCGFG
jgi:hypothetical protein